MWESRLSRLVRKAPAGFSLLELMVTVAIVSLLAAIAYPSYTAFVMRSNRAAAQAEMMNIASLEQQYFLANKSYTDLSGLGSYQVSSQVSTRYDCSVAPTTTPSFTITCVPKGAQSGDGNLVIGSNGSRTRNGDPSQW